MIFDGRQMASQMEARLREEVRELTDKLGRKPKIVSILDPNNEGSVKYTNLKEKMAQRLGVEYQSILVSSRLKRSEMEGSLGPFGGLRAGYARDDNVGERIKDLNKDEGVDGVMIQLPLFGEQESRRVEEYKLVQLIDPKKDVDGLREDSLVKPAVVRAVLQILNAQCAMLNKLRVTVVGSKGMVGSRLVDQLIGISGYQVIGMDKEDFDPTSPRLRGADVVISVTGQAGLIRPEMVKEGVICIDVGYPKGDFAPEVGQKAGFFTPVPGGVGPVTVVSLFANLVDLAGE